MNSRSEASFFVTVGGGGGDCGLRLCGEVMMNEMVFRRCQVMASSGNIWIVLIRKVNLTITTGVILYKTRGSTGKRRDRLQPTRLRRMSNIKTRTHRCFRSRRRIPGITEEVFAHQMEQLLTIDVRG